MFRRARDAGADALGGHTSPVPMGGSQRAGQHMIRGHGPRPGGDVRHGGAPTGRLTFPGAGGRIAESPEQNHSQSIGGVGVAA